MTEREGVAIHDERADLNFLRAENFFVSLKLLVDENFCIGRFELQRDSVTVRIGRRRRVIEFYVAEEIIFREEGKIFFRQNFVAEFVEVPLYAKDFFEVVGRVEGVGGVEERKIFERHVANPDENQIVGRGLNFIQRVKNILVSVPITLAEIFHAVGQIIFVQHLLQVTGNCFVEGRVDSLVVARADEPDFVRKSFGLMSGLALVVAQFHQRVVVLPHGSGAVEIHDYRRGFQKFEDLCVGVTESVERRFDFAAFVFAEGSSQGLKRRELFAKINAVFESID